MPKRFAAFVLCMGLLTSSWAAEPPAPTPWVAYATAAGIGIVADAISTQQGLNRGAQEANPLYSWAGRDGVAPLRLGVGVLQIYALTKLHKTHPKTAKGLAIFSFALGITLAAHNDGVCQPSCMVD